MASNAPSHDGLLPDATRCGTGSATLIAFGSGWNDAVLFAEALAARAGRRRSRTKSPSLPKRSPAREERHRETMLQGAAFVAAPARWPHPVLERLPADCAYCVAVGAMPARTVCRWKTRSPPSCRPSPCNLVQAGIRLGVTGQSGAIAIVAALEPLVLETAGRAATSTLDDLGSATILSDIMAMKHETQLFEAVPLMMLLAVILTLVLAAIAALHAYWGIGGVWPGARSRPICARRVVGFRGSTHDAQSPVACFAVARALLLAIAALVLGGIIARPFPIRHAGPLQRSAIALVFLGRGIAGFTPAWRRLTPEQPFARLDVRYYSPLCLLIGAGFACSPSRSFPHDIDATDRFASASAARSAPARRRLPKSSARRCATNSRSPSSPTTSTPRKTP